MTTQEIIQAELQERFDKLRRRIREYESAITGLKYNIENLEITLDETRDALDEMYHEEVGLFKKLNKVNK